jgi:predicted nucleic acid-binding protein
LFANRYTAFADACSLVGALSSALSSGTSCLLWRRRSFFRLRWSKEVLDETERAIAGIFEKKGVVDPAGQAAKQRARMEEAFEESMVFDFDKLLSVCGDLPDPNDAHVIAAALKTQAATIITDNLKHFPTEPLRALNLEVRSTDAFIADTIALDTGRAVAAIRRMRESFKRPEMTPEQLSDHHGSGGADRNSGRASDSRAFPLTSWRQGGARLEMKNENWDSMN